MLIMHSLRFLNATDAFVSDLSVTGAAKVNTTLNVTGISTFETNAFFEQDIDVTGLTTTIPICWYWHHRAARY